MKKLFLLSACAATMWLAQACSSASETTSGDTTASSSDATTVVLADSLFIRQAAIGGKAEVELGNLALATSTNTSVKDFATMMVADHTKSNEELMAMAKSKSFTLPDSLDAEHKATADGLRGLTGAAFDKAYMNAMVDGHQKMLALLQSEAQGGMDANLKDYATKTAPVVQTHLEQAQKIQAGIR
ncbi:MAG: DUF4142 domain-containing protein [Sphingobacteriaceae bacterium]|nr:MAG: DUF4142 domain-containing protein [Sphingobacteriaceae bacterium]